LPLSVNMATSARDNPIIVRPSPTARASTSVDGLVLLDLGGGLVLTSNRVGARIWELIEHGAEPAAIARQLSLDYEVPLERAERDVAAFVRALATHALVITEPVLP
jgi:Coenzyme PQQ synthesis protein D (PqqD)